MTSFAGALRPPLLNFLLWALLLPSGAPAVWNPAQPVERGLGPLLIRSESPAQALRLTPLARAPVLPAAGEVEFTSMVNLASIWAKDPGERYFFDFHLADIRVGAMFGLPRGFAFEASLNERRTLNAHLDQMTLTTHELFGIGQNGRDSVPKNDFRISIPDYGVEFDEPFGSFTRSVELSLARKWLHETARWPALTMRMLFRIETLDDAPAGHGIDKGLQATLGKRYGSHLFYGNYAYTDFGSTEFYGIPLESKQFTGMLSYEFREHDNRSWIVQYLYGEGVVSGCGELSEPSHELHLGVKWRSGSGGIWQFALVENFINFNNSPDYGLAFAYTRPFSTEGTRAAFGI